MMRAMTRMRSEFMAHCAVRQSCPGRGLAWRSTMAGTNDMLTFAASNLVAGLLGLVPDIMKEVRDTRMHGRELELMQTQAVLTRDTKRIETDGAVLHEEMRATREHLAAIIEAQAKPTGIRWLDAFNGLLRPLCTSMVMGLMAYVTVTYTWAISSQYYAGTIPAEQFMTLIQAGFIGTMFEGVIGFLYGYRSTAAKAKA